MRNSNQLIIKQLIMIALLLLTSLANGTTICIGVYSYELKRVWQDTTNFNNKPNTTASNDTILPFAEKMPEFPGGRDSMMRFIASNIHAPSEAIENGTNGKVFVQFIINKFGKVSNPKVLKGIGGGCDEEALRVIQSLPDWIPGQQNGKYVSVYYTVPIEFQLASESPLIFVEKQPEFPGGVEALMKYITDNLKYPKESKRKGVCGRVFVQFVIDIQGKVINAKIIKSVRPDIDEEALRIVNSFPIWKPGTQNGKPVPVFFTLPILFNLGDCSEVVSNSIK